MIKKEYICGLLLTGLIAVSLGAAVISAAEEPETEETTIVEEDLPEMSAGEEIAEAVTREIASVFGESGILEGIFGEDGMIAQALPTEDDIDKIVNEVKTKLGEADAKVSEALEDFIAEMEEKEIPLEAEKVEEYLNSLISSILGFDKAGSDLDLDEMIRVYQEQRSAIEEYVRKKNAEKMDPGDVQIVSLGCVFSADELYELEENEELYCCLQYNYSENHAHELYFLDSARDAAIFTLVKKEDGSWSVEDAEFAEEGDDFMPSLEALCEKILCPLDECLETLEFNEMDFPRELKQYMEDHPEITGIEYEGEMRTMDELDEIWSLNMDELFGE